MTTVKRIENKEKSVTMVKCAKNHLIGVPKTVPILHNLIVQLLKLAENCIMPFSG